MTAQEMIAAIQGGVISVSFLLSIISAPKLFTLWANWRKEMAAIAATEAEKNRALEAAERAADRFVRREDAKVLIDAMGVHAKMLADSTNALRERLQTFCRYDLCDDRK